MATAEQQLSGDEFHRMQLQILELRTENYQLKDDVIKLKRENARALESESKLEREVSKQIKLRKAFTTLNKSKQAVEFEELLRQNEEAFILQNQTLAEELSKLQNMVKTLENENRQFKRQISLAPQDKAKDTELRKLQASNAALMKSLEMMKLSKSSDAGQDTVDSVDASECSDGQSENELTVQVQEDESLNKSVPKVDHGDSDADLQVQILTLQEEKRLLEFELDNASKKHDAKVLEMTDAMSALQTKLDQKQKSCNSLQKNLNELQAFKNDAIASAKKMNEENERLRSSVVKESSEKAVLQNTVQESQVIMKQQQESLLHWQKQVDLKEDELKNLKLQYSKNLETLSKVTKDFESSLSSLELLQKEKDELQAKYEKSASAGEALLNQHTDLERKMEKLEHELHQNKMEAEKQKSELQEIDRYKNRIEQLESDLANASALAEKRKKLADGQSVEIQEVVAKLNNQMTEMESSYEDKIKSLIEKNETDIKALESTIKAHEKELIRAHHQERVKTREIDGLQQKINDLNAEKSSLENSKGWFERALQDAEKTAEAKKSEHDDSIEKLKESHARELEEALLIVNAKDEDIKLHEQRIEDMGKEIEERERKISSLKQDIKDEVQKQRLVEKKVHTTVKDLKKQLSAERKKNELLQQKLEEQSAGKSNVEELLNVVDTSQQSNRPPSGGASSVSSFSFRDFINPTRSNATGSASPVMHRASSSPASTTSTQLTTNETTDLLNRVAELQSDKWALEERVRYLEESSGAMADELLEKSEMMQRYVQHTRTDTVKRNGEHSSPKSLSDKVKSFVTGQDDLPHSGIGNIYELNKKLTRMLEEEMTKNLSLKKDMELMAQQLGSR